LAHYKEGTFFPSFHHLLLKSNVFKLKHMSKRANPLKMRTFFLFLF